MTHVGAGLSVRSVVTNYYSTHYVECRNSRGRLGNAVPRPVCNQIGYILSVALASVIACVICQFILILVLIQLLAADKFSPSSLSSP